jgi:hypothetical protein
MIQPHALSERIRAAAPFASVLPQLGHLGNLPGTWVGSGVNIIALPDKHDDKPFRLKLSATRETLNFKTIGAPIPNRGSAQDDIRFLGLHYLQQVSDAVTNQALHLEPGLWLNLPSTTAPMQAPGIVRLATIPHGTSVLAEGTSLSVDRGPTIEPTDTTPFKLNASTGVRQNDTNATYLEPFTSLPVPPGIPAEVIRNPNVVLTNAIKGQKILKTEVLSVSATPVGGINGTPVVPPSANSPGGILNIPFVTTNANANSFSAIFWIETVESPDGYVYLQLQYSQTVILEFLGLKWPHVSVATLIKQ